MSSWKTVSIAPLPRVYCGQMQALLFDMDGVLYNGSVPIPGASQALAWVRQQKIPHLFVTNTTSRARPVLVEKLKSLDIFTVEDQIFSPPRATALWLRTQERGPLALFVPPATHSEFDGFPILPSHAETGARYVVVGDLVSPPGLSTHSTGRSGSCSPIPRPN